MGFYLNSNKPATLYANEIKKPYFVDKTDMLKEFIPLVESGTQYASALSNNQLADYWTSSGPYDEIFYYVKNDVAGVRDDIAKMIAGEVVQAQVKEYSATSPKISTRDEVLSAMVVYGFFTAADGYVRIPNMELMDKFVDMVQKEDSLGYG